MSTFIQLFEIIFNRRKVEDLKYDQTSLILVIAASTITTYWFGQVDTVYGIKLEQIKVSAVVAAIYSCILAAMLYKLLDIKGKRTRFNQCAVAFFGTSAIFGVLLMLSIQNQVFVLFGLAFVIWNIVVFVRIFKQTFEISTGRAFLYFIGVNLASNVILGIVSSIFITLTTGAPEK